MVVKVLLSLRAGKIFVCNFLDCNLFGIGVVSVGENRLWVVVFVVVFSVLATHSLPVKEWSEACFEFLVCSFESGT